MNIIDYWFKSSGCIFFLLFSTGVVNAQRYTGIIKNDKAFISLSVTGLIVPEELSKVWGVPAVEIISANPGLVSDLYPRSATIFIPAEKIIRTFACDSCKPVYHQVAKSEGLYRICKWYGNPSVANLKKMNQLSRDALQPGQELLVGYVSTQQNTMAVEVSIPAGSSTETASIVQDSNIAVEPVKETNVIETKHELSYLGEGIFETEFTPETPQIAIKQGKAASFKSESGWSDGRFYILNSQLKTGVVVKVIYPLSGKSIYAKVVGPLPKIKQNDKLDWRLSNAASASLGIWDEDEIIDLIIEY